MEDNRNSQNYSCESSSIGKTSLIEIKKTNQFSTQTDITIRTRYINCQEYENQQQCILVFRKDFNQFSKFLLKMLMLLQYFFLIEVIVCIQIVLHLGFNSQNLRYLKSINFCCRHKKRSHVHQISLVRKANFLDEFKIHLTSSKIEELIQDAFYIAL
ncbi:unnamed protein product [Paramecium sonneborni]|uniref:Transmembrane protein n=1 Tax=Paramecium sonneborni TaxID=65129 RepID=A0A8S1K600_9CILI|nr:unnamed protein product [Paramecium sonneborni]